MVLGDNLGLSSTALQASSPSALSVSSSMRSSRSAYVNITLRKILVEEECSSIGILSRTLLHHTSRYTLVADGTPCILQHPSQRSADVDTNLQGTISVLYYSKCQLWSPVLETASTKHFSGYNSPSLAPHPLRSGFSEGSRRNVFTSINYV